MRELGIHIDDGVLFAGELQVPVEDIEDVYATSTRPNVWVHLALLVGAALVGTPVAVVASHRAGGSAGVLFLVIGATVLYSLYQLVWAPERFTLVIRESGRERVLARVDEAQPVIAAVAELQGLVRPRRDPVPLRPCPPHQLR